MEMKMLFSILIKTFQLRMDKETFKGHRFVKGIKKSIPHLRGHVG